MSDSNKKKAMPAKKVVATKKYKMTKKERGRLERLKIPLQGPQLEMSEQALSEIDEWIPMGLQHAKFLFRDSLKETWFCPAYIPVRAQSCNDHHKGIEDRIFFYEGLPQLKRQMPYLLALNALGFNIKVGLNQRWHPVGGRFEVPLVWTSCYKAVVAENHPSEFWINTRIRRRFRVFTGPRGEQDIYFRHKWAYNLKEGLEVTNSLGWKIYVPTETYVETSYQHLAGTINWDPVLDGETPFRTKLVKGK
ncbi:MAG: hypothetical protein ABIK09_18465 [Pseudomonadota bacterium]